MVRFDRETKWGDQTTLQATEQGRGPVRLVDLQLREQVPGGSAISLIYSSSSYNVVGAGGGVVLVQLAIGFGAGGVRHRLNVSASPAGSIAIPAQALDVEAELDRLVPLASQADNIRIRCHASLTFTKKAGLYLIPIWNVTTQQGAVPQFAKRVRLNTDSWSPDGNASIDQGARLRMYFEESSAPDGIPPVATYRSHHLTDRQWVIVPPGAGWYLIDGLNASTGALWGLEWEIEA
jgi:hypothetical protein